MNRKTLTSACVDLSRDIVLEMSGHTCQLCGGKAIETHHIIRKGMGGGNVRAAIAVFNQLAICRLCHGKLHAMGQKAEYAFIEADFPEVWSYVQAYAYPKGTIPLGWLAEERDRMKLVLKTLRAKRRA